MTNDPVQLSAEQRTDLVAYLDGELNEDATQQMERLLAESPQARHEVDMLGRTFALLDTLPRPNASEEFSANTLAVLKAESDASRWIDRPWYRHTRRGLVLAVWVVGLVLAGTTGYFAANRFVPSEETRLIRELPVIENVDTYSDVDFELLKELEKEDVFDDEPNSAR